MFNYDFAVKYCLVLNCLTSYLCLNNNIVSRFIYLCHVVLYLIFRIFIVFLLSCLFIIIIIFIFIFILFIMFYFLYFIYRIFTTFIGLNAFFWPKSRPKLVQGEAQAAAR